MRSIVICCLFCLVSHLAKAQLEGLWGITSVSMGEESRTPVAKWIKISKDGTYTGGNGWLQNDIGTWTQDLKAGTFLPTSTINPADPAGAFTFKIASTTMTWTRTEEGMSVTVHLERIDQLPPSPPDQFVGLWQLQRVESQKHEAATNVPQEYLHIRWDHLYRKITKDGQQWGFWIIHAHRPDLSMLPHDDSDNQYWKVRFEKNQLILEGNSDQNRGEKRGYIRAMEWPE